MNDPNRYQLGIDPVAEKAVEHFGPRAQIIKAIEEMGELSAALARGLNNIGTVEAVIEEIADVTIMMRQLRFIYGPERVDAEIERKLARLVRRMEGG